MFSKDLSQQTFSGDSEVWGGLGASEQEVAGAEASIMGVVCSRCVAPWHGQGEVAVPTVSTALGSSAEL